MDRKRSFKLNKQHQPIQVKYPKQDAEVLKNRLNRVLSFVSLGPVKSSHFMRTCFWTPQVLMSSPAYMSCIFIRTPHLSNHPFFLCPAVTTFWVCLCFQSPVKYLLPERNTSDYGKNCVVIDLDETLVHSSFKVMPICIENVNSLCRWVTFHMHCSHTPSCSLYKFR